MFLSVRCNLSVYVFPSGPCRTPDVARASSALHTLGMTRLRFRVSAEVRIKRVVDLSAVRSICWEGSRPSPLVREHPIGQIKAAIQGQVCSVPTLHLAIHVSKRRKRTLQICTQGRLRAQLGKRKIREQVFCSGCIFSAILEAKNLRKKCSRSSCFPFANNCIRFLAIWHFPLFVWASSLFRHCR